MNADSVVNTLRDTIDPNKRQDAEKTLTEMKKILSFCPILLGIVDNDANDLPVRQSAAIYLKNLVHSHWNEACSGTKVSLDGSIPFVIHEQDRHNIRLQIVDAVVRTPDILRVQLATCVKEILKHDFPERWSSVVDQIMKHIGPEPVAMSIPVTSRWLGALTVLYALVKNYEYKKDEERRPLIEIMKPLLPLLHDRLKVLITDQSEQIVEIQKLILKIFYALVQFSFNLELFSMEVFVSWMEMTRHIVEQKVPEESLQVDADERPELVWWKCKKWAMHLLHRVFERYGTPGTVASEYTQFADFYLKNCTGPVFQTVFGILKRHREGEYFSPRVLYDALMYLSEGTNHAFSWKCIKGHMMEIIQEIIFPFMCHSTEDEELWEEDPLEFIRSKYDVMEELLSPVYASITLLQSSMKRKNVLSQTIQFVISLLHNEASSPQSKDGAIHIIGTISDSILKKKAYRDEAESLLTMHVFPLFQSPHRFLRARGAWCLREFAETKFKQRENLERAFLLSMEAFMNDSELPVQVEGAMAIQMLLAEQGEQGAQIIQPHVKTVIMKLIDLIAKTHNDDLCTVIQKLVEDFPEEIAQVAEEVATHMVNIFQGLRQSEESDEVGSCESKALTAMGILSSLESLLDILEDHKEIMTRVEARIIPLIVSVLHDTMMDFYEEILTLVYSLTCQHISPEMWRVFDAILQVFSTDAADYFTDMMPAIHNYVTVDVEAFLADSSRIERVISMCKCTIENDNLGEDDQCHAAKLLEVVLLQFPHRIDQYVQPIVQIVLGRLTKELKTSELRTMCLQVLIAALFYNQELFVQILRNLEPPGSSLPLFDTFITQWLDDTDCFLGLHDRKLCVLGLMTLLTMSPRPSALEKLENAKQILPSAILLFDGLQRMYEIKAKEAKDDDGSSTSTEVSDDIEGDALDSDEDEIDDNGKQYLEMLARGDGDSGNEDIYSEIGETDLEVYETLLDKESTPSIVDEFVLFKQTLKRLEEQDADFCKVLVAELTPTQQEKIQNLFVLADKKQAAFQSKEIENRGGYNFTIQSIPQSFNFGE